MKTYRISISDRTNKRTVSAASAADAVRAAVGQRCINTRMDSWSQDNTSYEFDIAVQTGPTRNGATPFRNIRATVDVL